MDHYAKQSDKPALPGHHDATCSISWDQVINLKDSGSTKGTNATIRIDQSILERPVNGACGAAIVSENEAVKVTNHGKPTPEHVTNHLTLTERGHNIHIEDRTNIYTPAQRLSAENQKAHGKDTTRHTLHETPKSKTAGEDALPKLDIHWR